MRAVVFFLDQNFFISETFRATSREKVRKLVKVTVTSDPPYLYVKGY